MMKRNILEAIKYAVIGYIRYAITFVILYTLFNQTSEIKKILFFWCIPLAMGEFLGYLGGKQFEFFSKKRYVFIAICVLIILNLISAYLIKYLIFQEANWILKQIMLIFPMCLGYGLSMSQGLKLRKQEN